MRRLDASPRRAAPKGHETFISRAASFSHRLLPRATPFRAHGAKCRLANVLANVGAVAALGRPVCPVRRVHRGAPRGRNVETPRYVEHPHVLRVPYFHVLQSFQVAQSFHDHWPAHDATAGPAAVARPAGRRLCAVPGGASLPRPAITGAVVARAPSGADGKNSLNGIDASAGIWTALCWCFQHLPLRFLRFPPQAFLMFSVATTPSIRSGESS